VVAGTYPVLLRRAAAVQLLVVEGTDIAAHLKHRYDVEAELDDPLAVWQQQDGLPSRKQEHPRPLRPQLVFRRFFPLPVR
jgi:hypothetical protein